MSYNQLTLEQRYGIKAYMQTGLEFSKLATYLGVHRSTIYREVTRNHGSRGYRPHQASQKAIERKRNASKHIRFTSDLQVWVIKLLQDDLSPEQVSGHLSKQESIQISHESIYQFIWSEKASRAGGTNVFAASSKKKRAQKGQPGACLNENFVGGLESLQ